MISPRICRNSRSKGAKSPLPVEERKPQKGRFLNSLKTVKGLRAPNLVEFLHCTCIFWESLTHT